MRNCLLARRQRAQEVGPAANERIEVRSSFILVMGMLLCSTGDVGAQALRGRVIDARSRDPIAGVRLRLVRADTLRVAEVMTNDSGRFMLRAEDRKSTRLNSSH